MFFSLLFPSALQLSLLELEPGQNPWCLASGPSEAQALRSHCKNSVRDSVIGKKWICSDIERSILCRVWAIAKGKCLGHGMSCRLVFFIPVGEVIC